LGLEIASPSGTNWKTAQITNARMSEKDAERQRNIAAAGTTAMITATITVEITATGNIFVASENPKRQRLKPNFVSQLYVTAEEAAEKLKTLLF
jgi:hypothetical protein